MSSTDSIVKDMSLAPWGRKEIAIAQTEMPGLMAIREEFAPQQPLRGAIFGAHRHEPGHLRLGDGDLLAAEVGQADVLDDVVVRHDGRASHASVQ